MAKCGKKRTYAHRFSYETLVGPIPEGKILDHLCRVRMCVNPDHLDVVTHGENLRRGFGTTGLRARQTHCIRGHELSGRNVKVYGGKRYCLTCGAARDASRPVMPCGQCGKGYTSKAMAYHLRAHARKAA